MFTQNPDIELAENLFLDLATEVRESYPEYHDVIDDVVGARLINLQVKPFD